MKEYEALEDIIFFGSFARGKTQPRDLDIALLISKKDESIIREIEKKINKEIKGFKIQFTLFALKDIYSKVWFSIVAGGYSVSKDNYIHTLYGIEPCRLYIYTLKSLNSVQKVQFSRGLHTVLKEAEGIHLSRTIVLFPIETSERFESFLKTWNIDFEAQRYDLLPEYVI